MAREQAEKEASRSSQSLSSGSSVNDSCLTIPVVAVKPHSPVSPTVNDAPSVLVNTSSSPKTNLEITSSNDVANALDEASMQDIKEAKKDISDVGKVNVTLLEEKVMDAEPLLYANKKEAKLAFRSLLESANLEADWSWEQAMRVIINDKRYGALKTLGERKQAFNEYLVEKKKLEAEEKRLKLKKAKDEFMQMLEESKELTSSMRWSKAIALFEDDKRYKAIERPSEREDLFQDYLVDLKKKERAKLQEEKRQNRLEYRHFLETCGFIKVDTQWRKVKDWLEDDERCSRLEKIDRLEIFQEYIRELEKEDDEQRKLKKEEIKKMERKNRDEFSKMMEEHVVSGMLTVNTQWVDYFQKVKESEAYHAVASNTSGATAKDLFEDVAEELEKKYHDDKTRVKDALKIKKVSVAATWTFKDFKDAIQDDIISPPLSDINLQLVFEDLLKRAKEKEKKEHKRRRNLAKDFTQLLDNIKEINASSTWEDCKQLFEESNVYRSIGDEKFCQVAFEEYVARLVEKGTDNKHKQEDEKMKREKKEKGKDRERKHGQSPIDHRKSRKHVSHESDDESKHKRHKDDGEHVHDHEDGDDVLLSNQFLKRRKHGENFNSFGMWQQFPNRSGSNHGQTQTQNQTQPGLTSFGGDLLEEQWYAGPEDVKERPCMMSSNVYSLGVLLFEILGSFITSKEHAVAMMNLRQRILPPRFLSENPKEAGFCLWLLHPEASARPTTRDILKSKLINEIEETSTDDLLSSIAQEDTESELLLHFLTSLKDQKQKQATNLIKDINYLKSDIKEIESRRQSIQENNKPPIIESRLKANLIHLESAYFSIRSSIKNDPTDTIDQENNKPLDRLGIFFNGLCKYARYSRFEVRGNLRGGDFSNSANVICSLGFDRDEDYFATAGVSKKIKVYDFHLLLDDSIDIHYPAIEMVNKSKVSCISWNSYIKNYLASTDYDGSVKIWDAGTGQTVSHHIEHEKRAWSVDFSRVDPTKLASGSDDCYVKLWSINEKKSVSTIRNIANVCCVQFSPFSSHLVCFGSADYRTYCYDLRNITTPLCILGGHDRAVSYVKFLDGETVISASTDNTLKLWDLKKTKFGCLSSDACIMTFKGHTNEKNFVGLSVADGYIACGSETNEVFAYYRSLPMPITAHKFGSIDPVSGKETDHANNQFVSSVCWRQKSDMVIAANSSGCLKLLQMV